MLIQAVMEVEAATKTGASFGERSPARTTYRNGYRARPWDTRVGTLELQVPRVREGSYFPSLLEPRRRSERALHAVVQQTYVEGVSTRRVEDLVQALGCKGISKSQVSRICQELDAVVDSFLRRPLVRRLGAALYAPARGLMRQRGICSSKPHARRDGAATQLLANDW